MECTENTTFPLYASVIFDLAVGKSLDYGIPAFLLDKAKKGVQVRVLLRGKEQTGYILELKEQADYSKVLPIQDVISDQALISEELFELAQWVSKYYCAPLWQVLKIILPAGVRDTMGPKQQFFVMRAKSKEVLNAECRSLQETNSSQAKVLEEMLKVKKGILLTELLEKIGVSRSPVDTLVKKGLLSLDILRIDRSPLVGEEYFRTTAKILTPEQQKAYDQISLALQEKRFETHLLFGVTGSGKTEVYLQLIEKTLQDGRGSVLLVPEISLTTQTIERFRSRFDSRIAILHHRLSQGERHDEWHRILRGEASIVVGARSAIFSPLPNPGLIIVDEEHDGAYKQSDDSPCYNARDLAVMRGKISNAVVILGSATPSLESYLNVKKGKYFLHTLTKRTEKAALPKMTIVDMKREFEKARGPTTFSEPLIEGLKERAQKGEQSILFLNRRGYHTHLLCKECGFVSKCPHCELSLTFHLHENTLACHLCDYRLRPPPASCQQCGARETLKYRGIGTEHVERSLKALLPDIRTLRVDTDTTRHKGSHDLLFRSFSTGKADVLIGTQMIAKGLHFPQVTLVAILNTDSALHLPDFRASERVFQLITQVAGRAGRGEIPGEVILQTHLPDHPLFQLALNGDYEGFVTQETESRKFFGFPPFGHLVKFCFAGEDPLQTEQTGQQFRALLTKTLPSSFFTHPLVPAGHAKVKDFYRFQFLVRGPTPFPINEKALQIFNLFSLPRGIRFSIDVDPLSTFF